jgi:hypothetical protein
VYEEAACAIEIKSMVASVRLGFLSRPTKVERSLAGVAFEQWSRRPVRTPSQVKQREVPRLAGVRGERPAQFSQEASA